MEIRIKILGAGRIANKFKKLSAVQQRRVIRPALTAAASPVNKKAKALAPKDTGLLRKSIGIKVKSYSRSGVIVAIIGPRSGFSREVNGQIRNPTKYSHLAEAARPFLKPALFGLKGQVQSIFATKIAANIDSLVRAL